MLIVAKVRPDPGSGTADATRVVPGSGIADAKRVMVNVESKQRNHGTTG